ncbi:MAG: DUF485 domain-containing protein [Deltaproteobacteria bacterium]|nr:DUF485 domain-containing protein [Deltaproteobacteria bacterium]
MPYTYLKGDPVAADLAQSAPKHDENASRNAKYGLCLFAVYLAFYGSFMGLNIAAPQLMASPSVGGVNFAIVYGFCLILAAFGLALVYMWLCSKRGIPEVSR